MKPTQREIGREAKRLCLLTEGKGTWFGGTMQMSRWGKLARHFLRRIAAAERRGAGRVFDKAAGPTIKYPLRVVRKKDGTMEWRD